MIKLKNICKSYFGKNIETKVLKDINLTVNEQEFISIYGKSGCGKSTLLNILGFMDDYTLGDYIFNNINVRDLNRNKIATLRNRNIGFVFQSFNLINEMTALDNVCVPLGYAGISYKKRTKIAKELLEKVGMAHRYKNYPSQLSGGEQQRVAIARALSNNPSIILADEPTGNLDSKTTIEIMELFKQIHLQKTTIIMVTHDESLSQYATKRILIEDGKIV